MARPKATSVSLESMGFPGYVATRAGAVLSLKLGPEPRPLTPEPHPKSRRLRVILWDKDGKRRAWSLARLILTAFGQPSPRGLGYVPAHRNGDLTDCRRANLKWVPKGAPERTRAVKLIRGLMRRYQITPDELS